MSKARISTIQQLPSACFAPPITDSILSTYESLIKSAAMTPEQKDAANTLLKCVKVWWDLPASTEKGTNWNIKVPVRNADGSVKTTTGPSGKIVPVYRDTQFVETPLGDQIKEGSLLWEVTPWMRELDALSNSQDTGLFDNLPSGALRNCVFHLLWVCKELTCDREPLTQDVLPK